MLSFIPQHLMFSEEQMRTNNLEYFLKLEIVDVVASHIIKSAIDISDASCGPHKLCHLIREPPFVLLVSSQLFLLVCKARHSHCVVL